MKLNTLPLAILLTLILMPRGYTQTPPVLPSGQSSGYGIISERHYPGTLVLELIQAAETEIDRAVSEAYAEGYKAAALRYAPELAGLRMAESALLAELENERRKNRLFWPVTGIAAGVFCVAGFALHSLVSR